MRKHFFESFLGRSMSSIGCTELFFFAEESGNTDDVKVVCLYLMWGESSLRHVLFSDGLIALTGFMVIF